MECLRSIQLSVRHVINNIYYGDITLVVISTCLRLMKILTLFFHADPCNKLYMQCCQLSGVSFRTEMSSFPDFQLHFRIFFVRCLALSFDIPAAVGSKSEGKTGHSRSTGVLARPCFGVPIQNFLSLPSYV